MKLEKLLTLSQFVDEIYKGFGFGNDKPIRKSWQRIGYIRSYNDFLKQPLKKEMFVLCNTEGQPIDDLQMCCGGSDCGCMGMPVNVSSQEEIDEVLDAREKVIFECEEDSMKYFVFSTQRLDSKWLLMNNMTLHDLAEATNGSLKLKNVEI